MKRRCTAVLLCLVMLLGLFPAAALAAGVVASGDCGLDSSSSVTWTLTDDGTLTISGSGAMADYQNIDTSRVPWYEYQESITGIVIDSGVTNIGKCAFEDCKYLTSVTIPDSVTSIGNVAFAFCRRLTSVTIPASVTSIGPYTLSSCYSLTSITIPASVTSIGEGAFYDCSSLADVYYGGTEAQWSNLASSGIGLDNDPLLNATIHYSSGGGNSSSTLTVTFNPNGASGSAYTQTVTAGQAATLTHNTFTRTDYTFTGWNTAADGSGTAYKDEASVTLSDNLTLYAQWAQSSLNYIFLPGQSRSSLYVTDDDEYYYEYNAMMDGKVETILVKKGTMFKVNAGTNREGYTMDPADGASPWNGVTLNNTTFDADNIMVRGPDFHCGWTAGAVFGAVHRRQGAVSRQER